MSVPANSTSTDHGRPNLHLPTGVALHQNSRQQGNQVPRPQLPCAAASMVADAFRPDHRPPSLSACAGCPSSVWTGCAPANHHAL
jgi:hypothetical protein